MTPIIQVQNLVKKYKKATSNAVDGISFSVNTGKFFSLLGPNGAGKTTTISILTTTLSKTSGTMEIAGFNVDKNPSEVRRSVGIIFQNPSLDLNLTAEENIRLHTILYGMYSFRPTFSLMPQEYKKRVFELSEVLGIKEDVFKPIKTFSGGMKRKLEIIRSLMHRPKVLFLDEPTIGLDPVSRKNLWEYLTSIRKSEKITIFLTTHYLEEAQDADHICIIKNGKIVSQGTPQKITSDLIDEYVVIDSPKKEQLRKELTQQKVLFKENGGFKITVKAKDVWKMIRSIDTPLSLVRTHTPTLEEAYLEIVERNETTNA